MPRRVWDKADFDEAYGGHVPIPGLPLSKKVWRGYGRHQFGFFEQKADRLVALLTLTDTDRVAILGAGFGWLVEALEDRVPGMEVVGTDTSAWIHSEKSNSEEIEIEAQIASYTEPEKVIVRAHFNAQPYSRNPAKVLNESGQNGQSRARIRQALNGNGTLHVVIDDVDPGLDDSETVALSVIANQIGDTVTHIVSCLDRGNFITDYNWKTLEDWKALVPADTWVEMVQPMRAL